MLNYTKRQIYEDARKHGEIKSDQVTRTSHDGTNFPIPDEMSPRELSKKLYEHNKTYNYD